MSISKCRDLLNPKLPDLENSTNLVKTNLYVYSYKKRDVYKAISLMSNTRIYVQLSILQHGRTRGSTTMLHL